MKYTKDFISVYQRKMAVFPFMYGEAGTGGKEFGASIGTHHSIVIETFNDRQANWYFSASEWEQMAESILQKLLSGEFKPETFRTNVIKYAKEALNLLNKSLPKLKTFDHHQLHNLVDQFIKLQRMLVAWGDPISFTAEQATIKKLNELLAPSIDDPNKRQEILAQLIGFDKPSFSTQEECELVAIAAKNDLSGLKEHAKKWVHLAFDYTGPVTTYAEFKERFDHLRKENLGEKIGTCKNYNSIIKQEKQRLVSQYNISEEAQQLAAIITQTSFIYDLRKSYMTKLTYLFSNVLDRVAAATDTPRPWINWLFEQEVLNLLDGKFKPTAGMIAARQKNGVVVYENGTARFVSDKEKSKYLALLENQADLDNTKELTGQAGSPGIIEAKVNRIMSATHNKKMRRGDVLVAPMTTVDFLPAMRLASAIVTDVGGITSHAAIVARELKIPAVVGTRMATKFLKDGQKIEVDGTKGLVKIIATEVE